MHAPRAPHNLESTPPPITEQRHTLSIGIGNRSISVRTLPGERPIIVWLGGFRSDMASTKASRLAQWAAAQGRALVRFDYSGHGESGGRFEEGTIGAWLGEAVAVISAFGGPAPLLVGSSMGGWLALLAARQRLAEDRPVAGLVLIAPAADFTEELMWASFSPAIRQIILAEGVWLRPSPYSSDPLPVTRQLIEEGRNHLLLGGSFRVGCPVHILQGMQDEDVPWRHAQKLIERLAEDDAVLTLVKDGDHRLSRAEDLDRMFAAIEAIAPRDGYRHTLDR